MPGGAQKPARANPPLPDEETGISILGWGSACVPLVRFDMKIKLNPGSRQLASQSRPLVSLTARNGPLSKLTQILVP